MHASPWRRVTLFHDNVRDKYRPKLMLVYYIGEWMGITVNFNNSIEETCQVEKIFIFLSYYFRSKPF